MKTYRDIAGDGGSDIAGQVVEQTRRLSVRLSSIQHAVAVMSGKGGVGKSAVSVNLAVALAAAGCRVGLLDADINGPSVAKMTGVHGQRPTILPEGVVPVSGPAGLKVMSMDLFLASDDSPVEWQGPSSEAYVWRQTMEMTAVREFLSDTLWGDLDYLVLDLPPGTDRLPNLSGLLPKLDGCVAVTLPSEISQFVVQKSIQAARTPGVRLLGLIENMSGYLCPGCQGLQPLFPSGRVEALAARQGIPYLGRIPFDPRFSEAMDRGCPVVLGKPDSPVSAAFISIAASLRNILAHRTSPPPSSHRGVSS
ncbi:MAG: P-loop NTPase [Planctomycetes bacterium]|nr:P-loop NTPase [Planctomycetota bacterium]